MKVISVMTGKGGGGKTTIAWHIAQRLQQRGFKTKVLDADPNSSMYMRFERRLDSVDNGLLKDLDFPEVQTFKPSMNTVHRQLAKQGENCDVLLVDTVGRIESFHSMMAHLSDVVVIPTTPDSAAIANAIATCEALSEIQESNDGYPLYGVALLNFNHRGVAERGYRKLFDQEARFSKETRPCEIYKYADLHGLTVTELDKIMTPSKYTSSIENAAVDMRLLCDQIIDLMEAVEHD